MSFVCLFQLNGQADLWQEIGLAQNQRAANLSKTFLLNKSLLKTVLLNSPKEESKKVSSSTRILALPNPEGTIEKFKIVEYQMMEPTLAEKYPNIKTYYGISISDPFKMLRLDITEKGLRAEVKDRTNNYLVEPLSSETEYKVFYQKTDSTLLESVRCEIDHNAEISNTNRNQFSRSAGSCDFKTFRLAVATTAEYSNYFGAASSAQSGIVLSEVVTAMNRVNGIFEGELGIRMLLVGNTDQVFYYNASTDPYTNNSGVDMLNENTPVLNNIIGVNNYDIGHVFCTRGEGIATPASVCTGSKARGVSGRLAPITDSYYVDFVAHEMGHQLGAFHTQNNNCSRSSQSFEPGSGSTIMSYAGICDPDVQSTPDDYFHTASLIQIGNFVTTGAGTCYGTLSYSNSPPTVDAGQDYSIPKSTPFELVAIASDPDNDPLLYRWEQWDNELAIMPPFSGSVVGPMFRSYEPTSDANRYFPNLDDILNNTNNTWEVLPTVARSMDFIVTVKDETGTASCTESDSMSITVVGAAGPFLVTSPNTSVSLVGGQSTTITWDVAGTNNAPINCSEVDILLSYDLGLTYTDTLASNETNDGSAVVVLPSPASSGARIMIKCSDNIFFDVSDIFFTILPDPNDTDGDGVANGIDCAPNDPNIAIVDSCGICGGDGTTCIDMDNDGFIADIDPDDNDPCNPDNTVGACDSDNDGTPDGFDCAPFDNTASVLDSCNVCGGNGLTCVDVDGDGYFADVDPDDNDPCNPDNLNNACDSDNDGVVDGLDCAPLDFNASVLDSCGVCGGDGTSCVDADGDGVFADTDPNDNDPCTPDNTNSLCDTDSDGVADGLDCAPFNPGVSMLDSCGVCGGDGTSCVDVDGDGYFADEDPDDNDPCNPDSFSNACDSDGDGTADGFDCAPSDPNLAILDSCSVCGGDGTSCADLDGDGYIGDIDPDDNDPCNPDNNSAACNAQANCNLKVNNTNSNGDGSLINAINCAITGDTITFEPSLNGQVIELTNQAAEINKNLFILTDPINNITVKGIGIPNTFHIMSGAMVKIEGLNIVCGTAIEGRGILNEGILTIRDVMILEANPPIGSGNLVKNLNELRVEGNCNIQE